MAEHIIEHSYARPGPMTAFRQQRIASKAERLPIGTFFDKETHRKVTIGKHAVGTQVVFEKPDKLGVWKTTIEVGPGVLGEFEPVIEALRTRIQDGNSETLQEYSSQKTFAENGLALHDVGRVIRLAGKLCTDQNIALVSDS